ncbi:hypothetical protein AB6O49_34645 [Streptomyces sp. SBR177]
MTASLPDLADPDAARIVADLTPAARGRIRAHLTAHPDALVSGASAAPRSVQALITTLADHGVTGVRAPACLRCGRVRPLRRAVPGGRVCLGCEGILANRGNIGACTVCGTIGPRPSRNTCAACRRRQAAATRTCSACGKPAELDPCSNCRPRPATPCALCHTTAPVTARWPLGPVCTPCYRTARSHPMPCPDCDRARVLIGRAEHRRVCGPCVGVPDPYACERCAGPRSYKVGRLCDRCAVADHLEDLFTDVPEAVGTRPLAAMRTALAEAPDAGTVLNWLRGSRSARLLHDLMATGRPPSHTDLDATIDGRATAMTAEYLRGLLIAYQVLEPRDELAVRIVRHLERTVARHPEHGALLRAYVRWSLLPRAKRHQAVRAGGVKHRIRWAYTRINLAAELLTTIAGHGLTIATLDQGRLDTWLAANPGTRYEVCDFVVWAHRRHHARDLLVPHRPKADPVGLDEDSHWDLLHQCLTDTRLDLDVRAAGAILLLFGQHLTRIAALPTTALTTGDGTTFLTLGRTPIPLPTTLADLLTTLADRPAPQGWAVNTSAGWLFPGHLPGAHISAAALSRRLAACHIPNRPARATALVALAGDLPPAVLGPMLGLHPITAVQWRRRAATDWTAYLQARQRALADGPPYPGPDSVVRQVRQAVPAVIRPVGPISADLH